MRFAVSLLMLGLMAGVAFARDPIAEVQPLFEGRSAWVQEADDIGGISLRFMNINLQEEADRREFRGKIAQAQSVIDVFEVHVVHSGDQALGTGGLMFLEELPKLRRINLGGCNYDAEDLTVLAKCPKLEYVGISGRMNAPGLKALGSAASVECIRAQYLRADWKHFPALPKLRLLDAESSDLNDAGAGALAKCPELQRVFAYSTQLTDKGLEELANVKKLEFLGVTSVHLSEKGIDTFRKARPDVEFLTEKPEPRRAPRKQPERPGPLAFLSQG